MPLWTLRFVASAGVVALLGRLPSSLPEAFLLALGVCLLAFGALLIADTAHRLARAPRPRASERGLTDRPDAVCPTPARRSAAPTLHA